MFSIAFALMLLVGGLVGFVLAAIHQDDQPDQDEFMSCSASCYCKAPALNSGRKGVK